MRDEENEQNNRLIEQKQEDEANLQTEKRYKIIHDLLNKEIEHVEKFNRDQLNVIG